MVTAGRHTGLWGDSRAVTLISLLHVALICQGLLGIHRHVGHVVSGHMRVLGDARSASLRREMLRSRLLGRVDLIAAVDAVLVARGGLRCVKTRLQRVTR